MVLTTGQLRELVHFFLDDSRDGVVGRVARFARLEEDVRVLRDAADDRVVRIEGAFAEVADGVEVHHVANGRFRQFFQFVDFVRGAETVEEVEERNVAAVRRRVRDHRHVVRFLNRAAAEHRPTAGAGRHHVGVVAEDRERVRGDAASRNVEDGRRLFAGDLEHVRNHQEETLRRGERAGQRARLQRAVNGARRPGFALHFDDLRNRAEEIFLTFRGPVVGQFAHRRRRRDRVNGHYFVAKMRDHRGGFVAVAHDEAFFVAHLSLLVKYSFGAPLIGRRKEARRVVSPRGKSRPKTSRFDAARGGRARPIFFALILPPVSTFGKRGAALLFYFRRLGARGTDVSRAFCSKRLV